MADRSARQLTRWTHETAVRVIHEAGLEPLEPYPGRTTTPWRCRCITCGAVVAPNLNNLTRGMSRGCRYCSARADKESSNGHTRWTHESASAIMRTAGLEPLDLYPGTDDAGRGFIGVDRRGGPQELADPVHEPAVPDQRGGPGPDPGHPPGGGRDPGELAQQHRGPVNRDVMAAGQVRAVRAGLRPVAGPRPDMRRELALGHRPAVRALLRLRHVLGDLRLRGRPDIGDLMPPRRRRRLPRPGPRRSGGTPPAGSHSSHPGHRAGTSSPRDHPAAYPAAASPAPAATDPWSSSPSYAGHRRKAGARTWTSPGAPAAQAHQPAPKAARSARSAAQPARSAQRSAGTPPPAAPPARQPAARTAAQPRAGQERRTQLAMITIPALQSTARPCVSPGGAMILRAMIALVARRLAVTAR